MTPGTLYARLLPHVQLAKQYEDEEAQAAALRVIPITKLMNVAQEEANDILSRFDELASASATITSASEQRPNKSAVLKHCLLLQLLKWFKTEFFCWFDREKCAACNDVPCVAVQNARLAVSTADERRHGCGDRVEVYQCPQCEKCYRFPRYNDPIKLLETRRGRCGEWANAFTLCCRACGFDARFVLDFTDHVWTEVWSELENRWLHCDPCENICDKPLLYEAGWGKKLSYVFAFSRDELVDVTWRYTAKPRQLVRRRRLLPEPELLEVINSLNRTHFSSLPARRADVVLKRRVNEVVEFMNCSCRQATSAEQQGRSSGSLAWRLARGEIQPGMNEKSRFIFNFDDADNAVNDVRFHYNVVADNYAVYFDDRMVKEHKRWSSCVFKSQNLARKEEPDWNMVYLCRMPNSDPKLNGEIEWRFGLPSCRKIKRLVVHARNTACFDSGCVKWSVAVLQARKTDADDEAVTNHTVVNDVNELASGLDCSHLLTSETFSEGAPVVFSVQATLSGGEGGVGWQKAQLFRSSTISTQHDTTNPSDWHFMVSIELEKHL